MGLDGLEKLADSVEVLKGRYLSLKSEKDGLLEEIRVLSEAKKKVRVLEAEREVLRGKVDVLIESLEDLTAGEQT